MRLISPRILRLERHIDRQSCFVKASHFEPQITFKNVQDNQIEVFAKWFVES